MSVAFDPDDIATVALIGGGTIPVECTGEECPACSMHYDAEGHPTCDCTYCQECGVVYSGNDDNGVQVAATDELAEKHDPTDQGRCWKCWESVS